MKIGEVGLMTADVCRLADFYKWLLGTDNGSDDRYHQVIISDETVLAICFADDAASMGRGGICLAFTVSDVDAEYARLLSRGVTVPDPPADRPWGARNMRFLDPDGNTLYFRQFK